MLPSGGPADQPVAGLQRSTAVWDVPPMFAPPATITCPSARSRIATAWRPPPGRLPAAVHWPVPGSQISVVARTAAPVWPPTTITRPSWRRTCPWLPRGPDNEPVNDQLPVDGSQISAVAIGL